MNKLNICIETYIKILNVLDVNIIKSSIMIHRESLVSLGYVDDSLSKLKELNLVKSIKGRNGGYLLNKPLDEILLAEIIPLIPLKHKTLYRALETLKHTSFNRLIDII